MPKFGFAIDNRACIGCHACTVACKSEHEVPIGVNRTWVKYIEKGEFPNTKRSFNVQRCNHCVDAPCVEICPVTSLYIRPDGIVDFDNERCIGCKACMQACPYDALYLDPDTLTAAKCNYCTHRVDQGIEPACVVVCPVEAIVSGDLDDPTSKISLLDLGQRVQYPKVEKNTKPKLFYVGGETAALDPAAAPPREDYLWSAGAAVTLGVNKKSLSLADDESNEEARARRVYDQKKKPVIWGWMVSAYITTKAIAAGIPIITFIMFALGITQSPLPLSAAIASVLCLGITGYLLVADLTQPKRFLYVLLRPQWNSWLVRGAYIITAFGLGIPVVWITGNYVANYGVKFGFALVLALFAMATAGYTALLFAQARGRDYWQSPLLIVSMVVDALAAGVAACLLLGLMNWLGGTMMVFTAPNESVQVSAGTHTDPARIAIGIALILLVLVQLAELLPQHQTKNAELTAHAIVRGEFAGWFWIGAVAIGLAVPLGLVLFGGSLKLAAVLLLIGIAAKNHVLVQAPQRVPLS
ncbi:MAG: polysulfide reductase NrfD [Planctomycetes bacterium]|nr:polysulfide reductase NrfD [Planctomycetota bacterium]